MTNIRTRLTDALREQFIEMGTFPDTLKPLADALLSLPGIAIVGLDRIREMEAAAVKDIERAFTVENREYSIGYQAALRWIMAANAAKDGQ